MAKLKSYPILLNNGSWEQVEGHVFGEWGLRKVKDYWFLTHLRSGSAMPTPASFPNSLAAYRRLALALDQPDWKAIRDLKDVPTGDLKYLYEVFLATAQHVEEELQ